jgi:hypothetical protein
VRNRFPRPSDGPSPVGRESAAKGRVRDPREKTLFFGEGRGEASSPSLHSLAFTSRKMMQVTLGAILTFISALKTCGNTYFPEPHVFFVVRISGNFRDSCPQKHRRGGFEFRVRRRGPASVTERQVARAAGPRQLPRLAEPADERAVNWRLRSVADSIHRAAIVSDWVGQRQSNGVNSRKKFQLP